MAIARFTRRQVEVLKSLRDDGCSDVEFYRRRTIDPLLDHLLVSESTSGTLRITRRGKVATLLSGNAVQYPDESPAICLACMDDRCAECKGNDEFGNDCECAQYRRQHSDQRRTATA